MHFLAVSTCSSLSFCNILRMYVLLDGWKPESKYHQELMALHLRGNGCAKTPTIAEDLEFFKKVRRRSLPVCFVALCCSLFVGWF